MHPRPFALFATLTAFLVGSNPHSSAAEPAWWHTRGVLLPGAPPSDFAALNQGQLKTLAFGAWQEMEFGAGLGPPGSPISNLALSWLAPAPNPNERNDFAPVTIGQLKTIAAPFWDVLKAIHFESASPAYPWEAVLGDESDFALANIGQAKTLFSFDLKRDSDGDGISDIDEGIITLKHSDSDGTPDYLDTDSDDDGLSDAEEIAAGTSPYDADSDDDGVFDSDDQFPNESRLSEPIPTQTYAAIDMGSVMAPGSEYRGLAIRYDNQVVLSHIDGDYMKVAAWKDGTLLPNPRSRVLKTYTYEGGPEPVPLVLYPGLVTGDGLSAGHAYVGSPIEEEPHGSFLVSPATTAHPNGHFQYLPGYKFHALASSGFAFGVDDQTHPQDFAGAWRNPSPTFPPDPPAFPIFVFDTLEPSSSLAGRIAGGLGVTGHHYTSATDKGTVSVCMQSLLGGTPYFVSLFANVKQNGDQVTTNIHAMNTRMDSNVAYPMVMGHTDSDSFVIPNPPVERPANTQTPFFLDGYAKDFYTLLPAAFTRAIKNPFGIAINGLGNVFFTADVPVPNVPNAWRRANLVLDRHAGASGLPRIFETTGALAGYGYLSVEDDGNGFSDSHWFVRGGRDLLIPIDLKIWNSQDAASEVVDKTGTGAFTVANLNDTDGDGTVNNADNDVPGEKDLMKLYVGGYAGLTGKVKLTVKTGSVKFWEDKEKKTEIPLQSGAVLFDIPSGGMNKTIWVEATAVSSAVRDIEIWEGYQDPQGNLTDGTDKAKATALWATRTQYANQGNQPLWADVQDPMRANFTATVGAFGKRYIDPSPSVPPGGIFFVNGFEYTVHPTGIGDEATVLFDVSRQIEGKEWAVVNGQLVQAANPVTFPQGDTANDDISRGDESPNPNNDHIYAFDAPGVAFRNTQVNQNGHIISQIIKRNNYNEYVRVSFSGVRTSGDRDIGSRCSAKQPWHMFMWLETQGTSYVERAGKQNDVDLDHVPLAPDPTP